MSKPTVPLRTLSVGDHVARPSDPSRIYIITGYDPPGDDRAARWRFTGAKGPFDSLDGESLWIPVKVTTPAPLVVMEEFDPGEVAALKTEIADLKGQINSALSVLASAHVAGDLVGQVTHLVKMHDAAVARAASMSALANQLELELETLKGADHDYAPDSADDCPICEDEREASAILQKGINETMEEAARRVVGDLELARSFVGLTNMARRQGYLLVPKEYFNRD